PAAPRAAHPDMTFLKSLFAPSRPAGGTDAPASPEWAALRAALANLALLQQEQQKAAVASQAALQRHIDAVGERLTERFEFVRRELFLELRDTLRAAPEGDAARPQPRVVDAERLASLRGRGLRLNVGCGHKPDVDRI